jgi:hypothetical protein
MILKRDERGCHWLELSKDRAVVIALKNIRVPYKACMVSYVFSKRTLLCTISS